MEGWWLRRTAERAAPHAVLIHDLRFLNQRDERVQTLVPGEDYVCAYRAEFCARATGVGFTMQINAATGPRARVGATAHHRAYIPRDMEPAWSASIHFAFACTLPAGVYVVTASVVGLVNGRERALDRRPEHLAFRVGSAAALGDQGLADLVVTPTITIAQRGRWTNHAAPVRSPEWNSHRPWVR